MLCARASHAAGTAAVYYDVQVYVFTASAPSAGLTWRDPLRAGAYRLGIISLSSAALIAFNR